MAETEVRRSVTVDAPLEQTFRTFTAGLGRWWPLSYTFKEDRFATAEIEPRAGGRWFERATDGRELSWGEVRSFEPPRRLVLAFGISPERQPEAPERASEVEVRFADDAGRTRVEVIHRDFERHGAGGELLRQGMASRQGWSLLLAELARELRVR